MKKKEYTFTRLEIEKLSLKPGDVLAVKVTDKNVTTADMHYIHGFLKETLPPEVKFFLLNSDGIEFSIIHGEKDA